MGQNGTPIFEEKAGLLAGVFLVEIQREEKWVTLGYLRFEFFLSSAEKCYWKTWPQNHLQTLRWHRWAFCFSSSLTEDKSLCFPAPYEEKLLRREQ